jgi:microsomal epoxide hydrolase
MGLAATAGYRTMGRAGVRPFKLEAAPSAVARIRDRLIDAHWPCVPDDESHWSYGVNVTWLRGFVAYWIQEYDWDAAEARLNRWAQFVTTIDAIDLHFYWIKGSASRDRPLVLTHGWPGSVIEFQDVIERLAFPQRFGGQIEDGFDLIIPSLPGYGSSGRPKRPIGPRRIAALWRTLMVDRLGYDRFAAQGGDWGAAVSTWLGADHADVVAGIHLNMVANWAAPDGEPASDEEADYRRRVARVQSREFGYHAVQTTKPQTIGLALGDSPLGFAAWVLEKFESWGDTGGDIDSRFDRDTLITNLMLYLLNDAVTSSTWLYRGRAQEAAGGGYRDLSVSVPTGVALFPAEFIPYPPREVAERTYAIKRWTPMAAGGHFAALEEPVALSDDIRAFFDFL